MYALRLSERVGWFWGQLSAALVLACIGTAFAVVSVRDVAGRLTGAGLSIDMFDVIVAVVFYWSVLHVTMQLWSEMPGSRLFWISIPFVIAYGIFRTPIGGWFSGSQRIFFGLLGERAMLAAIFTSVALMLTDPLQLVSMLDDVHEWWHDVHERWSNVYEWRRDGRSGYAAGAYVEAGTDDMHGGAGLAPMLGAGAVGGTRGPAEAPAEREAGWVSEYRTYFE